jgi:putative heme iron utilization protein
MEYLEFIKQFDSLHIASSDGVYPHSSYSTYVIYQNSFYIFISDIAKHSANLKANPHASVMFIEDESKCENIFARKRVTVDILATMIEKNSQEYDNILEIYKKKYNKELVQTLSSLDFNIYKLEPKAMSCYFGFGKAKIVEHIHLEE